MKILAFAAILFMFSCAKSEKLLQTTNNRNRVIIERIIDTVNVISRDTTTLRALLECDSLGRVRIAELEAKEGEMASLKTSLKNNLINFQVETKYIERVKETIKTDTLYIEKIVTDHERIIIQLSWWKKVLIWLGVLFIAFLVYKVAKSRLNILR